MGALADLVNAAAGVGAGGGEGARLLLLVGEDQADLRFDVALAQLAGVTRAQARRWIDAGRARVGGRAARASQRVAAGDRIEAEPPGPVAARVLPEPLDVPVLYEDDDLVVVDKPAGLVVHPAPGHPSGTLVNGLLHRCGDLAGIGGVLRPGIVHRLDRGTSGVLVVAKRDAAHAALAAQFAEHSVERVYLAIVRAAPASSAGRIERAIGRHPRDRKRMSVGGGAARPAATAWRVLERFPARGCALLEVRPETGRTHQIRVHLASAGMPVAGDPLYGRARGGRTASGGREPPSVERAASRAGAKVAVAPRLDRPALHAALLGFTHPRTGARVRFEAPPPEDFREALARLRR
jgi:23S rRNA pseudouridine1911/1915/1917 synthase